MNIHDQKGVALITAVLIVALVTTVAVSMAATQQLDIRRTGNIFNADQAYLAVLGGEDYARFELDADKDKAKDSLDERWANPVLAPVEGVVLSGQLEDMQGRFNINNLLDNGAPSVVDVDRFQRLLGLLGLNTGIVGATIDWLDGDINPQPNGGAEDDYYMSLQPAYRAGDQLMASASELLLVAGMDYDSYKKLEPYVVALPERTKINVNTASAIVLATLAPNLTEQDGDTLVDGRGDSGYASVNDFLQQPVMKNQNIDPDTLDIKSSYFLMNATAEFDESSSRLFSLLSRDKNGKTSVVMRSRGVF